MPERDLSVLLGAMAVQQRPGRWCLVSASSLPDDVAVAAQIVEEEGITQVIEVADAERLDLEVDFVAAWLTLDVASALDAVGLTAIVATTLADAGIACNVLAGLHHDHLLVPFDLAPQAVRLLEALRDSAP